MFYLFYNDDISKSYGLSGILLLSIVSSDVNQCTISQKILAGRMEFIIYSVKIFPLPTIPPNISMAY